MCLLKSRLVFRRSPRWLSSHDENLSQGFVLIDVGAQVLKIVAHDIERITRERLLLNRPFNIFVIEATKRVNGKVYLVDVGKLDYIL